MGFNGDLMVIYGDLIGFIGDLMEIASGKRSHSRGKIHELTNSRLGHVQWQTVTNYQRY